MTKYGVSDNQILRLLFGRLGTELGVYYTVEIIEPGIVEFTCKYCATKFETDTTSITLLNHVELGH